jgi:protein-S-isoprenylcysteine O-methyltransferase Ste14
VNVTEDEGGTMSSTVVEVARRTVEVIALMRAAWVVLGFLRTLLRRRSIVATRWGWVELLTVPEPVVLAAVTCALAVHGAPASSSLRVVAAIVGAGLAVGAVALTVWAFRSLPSVGSGHYVLEGQPIIDRGAYGLIRHPLYLGAFMIWLGLAMVHASPLPLVVLAVYVVPIYVLYIREEERLMIERYGDAYREYQARVGGLLPRGRVSSR